ncbi:MAG: hypothetical protein U0230_20935 [Polyangiales bacterium]
MSRWPVTVALALALVGCDEGALDVELRASPNLDTATQVRAQVALVRVVLDAPGGLYHPGDEESSPTLSIRDFDGDPSDLELVADVVPPAARLPLVRIVRGGLPNVPIDVRVLGLGPDHDESRPVAQGELLGQRFGPDVRTLGLPFDLVPERRPPRISEVSVLSSTCSVVRVRVRFERPVKPATLLAAGSVVLLPASPPEGLEIDAEGREATIAVDPGRVETRSSRFAIEIRPSVLGADDVPLDQIPSVEGPQAFRADFPKPCPGSP